MKENYLYSLMCVAPSEGIIKKECGIDFELNELDHGLWRIKLEFTTILVKALFDELFEFENWGMKIYAFENFQDKLLMGFFKKK